MKKPFRLINVFRSLMIGAAVLAVYLPIKNLPSAGASDAGEAQSNQAKLPQGIQVASAQNSWQAVFAAGY